MKKCDKIHVKDFFIGIIILPIHLFLHIIVSIIFLICGTIYLTYLTMLGEPTVKYNLLYDYGKDKGLRFKKHGKSKI